MKIETYLKKAKFHIIYNEEKDKFIVQNRHGEYLGLNLWSFSSAEVITFNSFKQAYNEGKKYEDRIGIRDSSMNKYIKFNRFEIMDI